MSRTNKDRAKASYQWHRHEAPPAKAAQRRPSRRQIKQQLRCELEEVLLNIGS